MFVCMPRTWPSVAIPSDTISLNIASVSVWRAVKAASLAVSPADETRLFARKYSAISSIDCCAGMKFRLRIVFARVTL